ncbi:hypothetical protein [Streptomyces nigrescens]|nr:hypothetical protein [Streptomyces libani]MCX5450264.1 hypothetical protein [Streptomyces libani]
MAAARTPVPAQQQPGAVRGGRSLCPQDNGWTLRDVTVIGTST